MALTSQQQDGLVTLIARKGFRVRGRGGFLDRLGVGDAMTLDLLSDESYAWAVQWLNERQDAHDDRRARDGNMQSRDG